MELLKEALEEPKSSHNRTDRPYHAMRRKTLYVTCLLVAGGVLAFFFLPVFPIGAGGTVVETPYGGCIDCQYHHHVSLSYHWSAMASLAYHLFTCGESYFLKTVSIANMSFEGTLPMGNNSRLAEWYCGHYTGPH